MPDDTRLPQMRPSALRARRAGRALATVAAIFILLIALAFFAAPPLVRPLLEERLSQALARKVSIRDLAFNPLTLSATLRDVVVAERGEGPPLLRLDELDVNGEASSLFRWAPVVSELRLVHPVVSLVRNRDGRYSVSDLVDAMLAGPPGPTPRFSLSNIRIEDGRIDFDDRPEGQKHEVTDITIGIPFLSSLPVHADIQVAPRLAARVNGRPIDITGETRPFMDTHETRLHWEASELPLSRYVEYVPGELPVRVPAGTLDARIDVTYVGHGKDPPQVTIAGTARVAGLVVNERSGAPLARIDTVNLVVDAFDPIASRAEVRSIDVQGARLELRRSAEGAINVAALASPAAPSAAPPRDAKPLRFHVGNLNVKGGSVRYADDGVKPRYEAALQEVGVDITDLSNEAGHAARATLAFTTAAGEHARHTGTLVLAPFALDGRLEVTGLKVGPLLPYYGSALNLAVDDGTLDAAADVHLGSTATDIALSKLEGALREVVLRVPDEKQVLWHAPRIDIKGGAVEVARQSIRFELVEGHDVAATIRRGADGGFNFARLLKPAPGGQSATDDAWRVQFDEIVVDGSSILYADETVQPAANLAVTRVAFRAENISNTADGKGHIDLQAAVNKRGTITLAGPLSTRPPGGTLQVTARDVDLVAFQPYVSPYAHVVTTGGRVGLRGTLEVATQPAFKGRYRGDVVIADLTTLDEPTLSDLVKWKTLTLRGVDAASEPLAVAIDDIAADGVYVRLILSDQGVLNLQTLARKADASAAGAPPPSPSASTTSSTPWLRLGKAAVTDSQLDFTDHFIRPNYSANVTGVAGTMSTLAFDQTADIALRGSVQGDAPVEINGKINPLAQKLLLDLRADAHEIELPPLTPYSAKYVGYGIEKGKLSMKVHYLVEDRKLTAENTITLDQLTFGAKVDSPDATKLPVLLAVALLKDRNGVIDFNLPVSGSLDDPQFSVGGLVWRAIGNLILKVVTAPFALLGKLGGHGEELAYIEFAPGSATLDATGESKIDGLAKALAERPALKIDVAGRVDPATDGDALKRIALDRRIRAQKFGDLAKSPEPPASVDAVQVAPEEYDALLTRVYRASNPPKDAARQPSRADMEAYLLAHIPVSDDDLRQLAEGRAEVVRDRLADTDKVPPERVFVIAAKLDASDIKDKGKPTRVDFALR